MRHDFTGLPMVIGLGGPAGVGKTTVARAIIEVYPGSAKVISFADPIRAMLITLLKFDGHQDEAILNYLSQEGKTTGIDTLQGQSLRHAMRRIEDAAGAYDLVVIDDVRLPSEVDRLMDYTNVVRRLTRTSVEYTMEHITETPLALPTIRNDGAPEDTAKAILAEFTHPPAA